MVDSLVRKIGSLGARGLASDQQGVAPPEDISGGKFQQVVGDVFRGHDALQKTLDAQQASLSADIDFRNKKALAEIERKARESQGSPSGFAQGIASLGASIFEGFTQVEALKAQKAANEAELQQKQLAAQRKIQLEEEKESLAKQEAIVTYNVANAMFQVREVWRTQGVEKGTAFLNETVSQVLQDPRLASLSGDSQTKIINLLYNESKELQNQQRAASVASFEEIKKNQLALDTSVLDFGLASDIAKIKASTPSTINDVLEKAQTNVQGAIESIRERNGGTLDRATETRLYAHAYSELGAQLKETLGEEATNNKTAQAFIQLNEVANLLEFKVASGELTRAQADAKLQEMSISSGIPDLVPNLTYTEKSITQTTIDGLENARKLEELLNSDDVSFDPQSNQASIAKNLQVGEYLLQSFTDNNRSGIVMIEQALKNGQSVPSHLRQVPELASDLAADYEKSKTLGRDILKLNQDLSRLQAQANPEILGQRSVLRPPDLLGQTEKPRFEQAEGLPSPTASSAEIKALESRIEESEAQRGALLQKWRKYGVNLQDPRDTSYWQEMNKQAAPIFDEMRIKGLANRKKAEAAGQPVSTAPILNDGQIRTLAISKIGRTEETDAAIIKKFKEEAPQSPAVSKYLDTLLPLRSKLLDQAENSILSGVPKQTIIDQALAEFDKTEGAVYKVLSDAALGSLIKIGNNPQVDPNNPLSGLVIPDASANVAFSERLQSQRDKLRTDLATTISESFDTFQETYQTIKTEVRPPDIPANPSKDSDNTGSTPSPYPQNMSRDKNTGIVLPVRASSSGVRKKTTIDRKYENSVPHFSKGRGGTQVDRIVLHYTHGTSAQGAIDTWKGGRGASAHYIVERDGTVYSVVPESDTAWHTSGYNSRSIGIETVALQGQPWTPEQEVAIASLTREIKDRYNIDPNLIQVHNELSTTLDDANLGNRQQVRAWVDDKVLSISTTQNTSQITKSYAQHGKGIDLYSSGFGSVAVATSNGTVSSVSKDTVTVKNAQGVYEYFSRLKIPSVQVGATVVAGQPIGLINGNTLHYRLYTSNPEGKLNATPTIDPTVYLGQIQPEPNPTPGNTSSSTNSLPPGYTEVRPNVFVTPSGYTVDLKNLQWSPPGTTINTVNTQEPNSKMTGRVSINKSDWFRAKNDPTANYGYKQLSNRPKFLAEIAKMADELNLPAVFILDVMAFETGGTFSPSARNKVSGATGLIQFTDIGAKDVGTTRAALAQMSDLEQIPYVKRYFENVKRYARAKVPGWDYSTIEDVLAAVWSGWTFAARPAKERSGSYSSDGHISFSSYLNKLGSSVGRQYNHSYR